MTDEPQTIVAGEPLAYPGNCPESVARAIWGNALVDMVNADNADESEPPKPITGYRVYRREVRPTESQRRKATSKRGEWQFVGAWGRK